MADALTKSKSGNELFYLLIRNKCAAATANNVRTKMQNTAAGKQYLMLKNLKTRNFRRGNINSGDRGGEKPSSSNDRDDADH